MRVVLDTNVLISALITPAGLARRVVQSGIEGRFAYVVCPRLLAEFEAVALRPKIRRLVPESAAERFLVDLRGGAQAEPDPFAQPVSRDPNDDYLVALAVSAAADHLVTGDDDLLDLVGPPVPITSLRAFAALLDDASSGR